VREAKGHDVKFVALQQQEDLVALYNSAKVHAVQSWFETTGLVSLEAALCGSSVVSTNRGYASEYLGTDAAYCDPGNVSDIARAVKQALSQPPSSSFIERVKEQYCWERTAEKTSEAYLAALKLS
jgi:glycosyltransferase involved in cell wall biosynthesis